MPTMLSSNILLNTGDNDPVKKFKEAIENCDARNGCNNAKTSFETKIWSDGSSADFCYGGGETARCTITINGRFPSYEIGLSLRNLMTYSVDALGKKESKSSSRRDCPPPESCFNLTARSNLTALNLQKRAIRCPRRPCECEHGVDHTNFIFPDSLEVTNYLNNADKGHIGVETQCTISKVNRNCPSWFGLVSTGDRIAVTAAGVISPLGGVMTWGLNLACSMNNI